MDLKKLSELCKLVRYDILTSTTAAWSGHPTSSLSAVELVVTLFFGGPPDGGFFHQDLENPHEWYNDRFVLSKGHASPLLYSLYQVAGALTHEELMKLRTFNSPLEGHPTPNFKYADAATGSLGQGLSVGLGMALGIRLRKQKSKVFVLLGDSEFSEGQIYEALQLASHHKLNNLVGILDVNRLGQRGETMLGWDIEIYQKRVSAFGWETIIVKDGHNLEEVYKAFGETAQQIKPLMIIAKTIKGKGVSFLENQEGWHGKALSKEQLDKALEELGEVDLNLKGTIAKPISMGGGGGGTRQRAGGILPSTGGRKPPTGPVEKISTREAYGNAIKLVGQTDPNLVILDAEVSNSTFSETFAKEFPDRYFEMFIAEQNMISVAVGLAKLGFTPFASTFAAFLSRAHDQIRMAQYSQVNIKLVGSHVGVSIGKDGPSQMGLEDLAIMRSILESKIFYPSDASSTIKLTQLASEEKGIFYIRTAREKTPVIYSETEEFHIGGSKVLRQSDQDIVTVFSCGITLHEALKAYDQLKKDGTSAAIVDLYSVKPIDSETIKKMLQKTKNIIVVEDHYPAGGLGEAVLSAIGDGANFIHLCVRKLPHSATPEELLAYEEIDAEAIIKAVKKLAS